MKDTAQHLRTLEEIERDCIPGLVNVLREEGLEAVRYILWDMTGGTAITIPASGATEKQERIDWEMRVRMDRIMGAVLREAHKRQLEETMDALADEPGRFYKSHLDE